MNILLIIILCTSSRLYSAAYGVYYNTWGLSEKYPVAAYDKDAQPSQLTKLTKEMVMNPFWRMMKSRCQDFKIPALIVICNSLGSDSHYTARRYNITAAVYAGIDLPALQLQVKKVPSFLLLSDTVLMQDYLLTALLLEHKADPCEIANDGTPVIYYAETVRLAQLLINAGALKKDTTRNDGETLLHKAMLGNRAPALITLYIEHGINPLACDSDNRTPLMHLLIWISHDYYESHDPIITKASLLLEGLPKERSLALINAMNKDGETIFDMIKRRKSNATKNKNVIPQFDALHGYLVNTLMSLESIQETPLAKDDQADADDSSICYEEMGSKPSETTECNHEFHTGCLHAWLQKSQTCPYCRADL